MPQNKRSKTGPAILRPQSFECVKAIVVYVAKKTGKRTIDVETMLLTVTVLHKLCEKGVT